MGADIGWLDVAIQKGLIDSDPVAPALPSATPPTPARQPSLTTPTARRNLTIVVTVPIRVKSEANITGQLKAKLLRKAETKEAVFGSLPVLAIVPPGPWLVTLTRIGGKKLDDDNLQSSLKVVRDCVADWLQVNDGDRTRVRWKYRQRPGWASAVRIEIREI